MQWTCWGWDNGTRPLSSVVVESLGIAVVVAAAAVGIFANIKHIFHDPKCFNASHPAVNTAYLNRSHSAVVSPQEDRGSPIFCHIHQWGILFPIVFKREKNKGEAEKRLKGRLGHSDSTLTWRVVQGGSSRYCSKSDSIKSAMRSGT